MKIHEILTENVELTEGGILSTLFGNTIKNIAKGTKKLTRRSRAKARLAARREREFAANVAQIADDLKIITKPGKAILLMLEAGGLAGPFLTYYNQMQEVEAKLESGEIDKEEYEAYRREYLGIAIQSFVGMLVGYKALKIAGSVVAKITGLEKTSAALSRAGWDYVLYALNTAEGKQQLGELISEKITVGAGDVGTRVIDYFKYLFDKASKIDSATPSVDGTSPTGSTPAGTQPAGTTTPADTPLPSTDTPATPVDPATDNFYSTQLERDPATGKLKFRDFQPVEF